MRRGQQQLGAGNENASPLLIKIKYKFIVLGREPNRDELSSTNSLSIIFTSKRRIVILQQLCARPPDGEAAPGRRGWGRTGPEQ